MIILEFVLSLPFSFFAGAVPFGRMLVKLATGKDITEIGSGNMGFANCFREAGPIVGTLVLLLDIGKGFVLAYLIKSFYPDHLWWVQCWLVLVGLLAILGHCFTPFIKKKGSKGKGVSTACGFIFAINPWIAGAGLGIYGLNLLVTRKSSLGSLIAVLAAVGLSIGMQLGPIYISFFIISAIFVFYLHRGNIVRLWNGTEPDFKFKKVKTVEEHIYV